VEVHGSNEGGDEADMVAPVNDWEKRRRAMLAKEKPGFGVLLWRCSA